MAPIRVAIIGGGLGGCTLANGLLKHPHIEFDVFEGSSAFKEQGLAVGLATNAQNALSVIGADVRGSLEAAGGVKTSSTRIIMGEGPDKDTFLFDLTNVQQVIHVHRAQFLQELLKSVPTERLHVNKKLSSIDEGPNSLTLHFDDGTTSQAHAVIGCDGIHSTVRRIVLGDHESAEPRFGGFWDVRGLVPMHVAKERGIIDPENPSETGWVGNGSFMLHQFINNGEFVGIIGAATADEAWDATQWKSPVTKEQLTKAFGERGAFGESMIELLLEQPEPVAFGAFESGKAPTFSKGQVCVMGDAAHAMTPWQGSGAGTSIEDAMILELLLGKVTSPEDITAAFKAYDHVRRPRTQRLISSSREVGLAFCGRDSRIGLNVEKLRTELPQKWDFIWSLNMQQHCGDAVAAFERFSDAH